MHVSPDRSRVVSPPPPPTQFGTKIAWEDGFNQVAPFEVLADLEGDSVEEAASVQLSLGGLQATAEISG
jgi:hypothetical protein